MTDLEMLKRAKKIKGLLESGRCGDTNGEIKQKNNLQKY